MCHYQYKIINNELKKPNIKGLPRYIQTHIMRLRVNAYKKCLFNCSNKCISCDKPFSTKHYLLECFKSEEYRSEIFDSESTTELDSDTLLTNLFAIEDLTGYVKLSKFISNNPPLYYCDENHPSFRDVKPWKPTFSNDQNSCHSH